MSAFNGARELRWQGLERSAVDQEMEKEIKSKRDMPYVMASGTWWAHVMIEH